MAAGHKHAAPNAGARWSTRLGAAFALTATFFAVELVAGLYADSLALVSDAGHMASDVVALGASLVATRIAVRPDRTGRRSYGRYRAEVFASGFTVLLMLGVGAYVIVEAVTRIGDPADVASGTMLLIGVIGLVVNVVSLGLLRTGSRESINVRGAYLEVLGDAFGSVGVIVAALLINWTGDSVWDTLVALAIGAFVVVRAVGLGRQVLAILGQQVPAGIDSARIDDELAAIPGVTDVHDLHLWTLTSGMNVATAHLVVDDESMSHGVLDAARDLLRDRHGIAHATLQVEPRTHTGCQELHW